MRRGRGDMVCGAQRALAAGVLSVLSVLAASAPCDAQEPRGVSTDRFGVGHDDARCADEVGSIRCDMAGDRIARELTEPIGRCGQVEYFATSDPDGSFDLLLEIDTQGRVSQASALPDTPFASDAFFGCVERAARGLALGPGRPLSIAQRWRLARILRAGHGDASSPWHVLGDVHIGGGTILWPGETRDGYVVGLRGALFYDWFGVSLSFDTTDEFDEVPGAAAIWSLRLAARPELQLGEELVLFGTLEAGVAMSSGQGGPPGRRQVDDEPALSTVASIGIGYQRWTISIAFFDALSASTHRLAGVLAIGGDFHVR
ncbi:MAG: hypothetical protein J0L92_27735 [Deltaproteobacteria bacterium]|nr:hypothetical protein [Deltaproteobacteria bacterium]